MSSKIKVKMASDEAEDPFAIDDSISTNRSSHGAAYNLNAFYKTNKRSVIRTMADKYPELHQHQVEQKAVSYITEVFHNAANEIASESRVASFIAGTVFGLAAVLGFAVQDIGILAVGGCFSIAAGYVALRETQCGRNISRQVKEGGESLFDRNAHGCKVKYERAQRTIDEFLCKAGKSTSPFPAG